MYSFKDFTNNILYIKRGGQITQNLYSSNSATTNLIKITPLVKVEVQFQILHSTLEFL